MGFHVFPSELDLGEWNGDHSAWCREFQFAKAILSSKKSTLSSYRITGMTMVDGGGSSVNIAPGEAYVDGFLVSNDATENLAGLQAGTNYIFVRLILTDGVVSIAEYYSNTSGTPPADHACLIGRAVVSGGVSTPTSAIETPTIASGSFTNGTDPHSIWLGFRPREVEFWTKEWNQSGSFWMKKYLRHASNDWELEMEVGFLISAPGDGGWTPDITIDDFGFSIVAGAGHQSATLYWTAIV